MADNSCANGGTTHIPLKLVDPTTGKFFLLQQDVTPEKIILNIKDQDGNFKPIITLEITGNHERYLEVGLEMNPQNRGRCINALRWISNWMKTPPEGNGDTEKKE
jgi:hypothetical protein